MRITDEQLERLGLDPSSRFGPATIIFGPKQMEPSDWTEKVQSCEGYIDETHFGCVRIVTRLEERERPNGETRVFTVTTIMDRPKDGPDRPWKMRSEVESYDTPQMSHDRAITSCHEGFNNGSYGECLESIRSRTPNPEMFRHLTDQMTKTPVVMVPTDGGWAANLPANIRGKIMTDSELVSIITIKPHGWEDLFRRRIHNLISAHWDTFVNHKTEPVQCYPKDLNQVVVAQAVGPFAMGTDPIHKGDTILDLVYFFDKVALPYGKL